MYKTVLRIWLDFIILKFFTATSIRDTFIQAMREIEEDTKVHGHTCVHFVPKTSSDHDYIYIVPQTG